MLEIDVIVPTLNEERAIATCLAPLVSNFRRVHVVDSKSTDRTVEIARAMGAVTTDFDWDGRYPKKKQWSLENLDFKSEWVLFVDADEVVTDALLDEIRSLDLHDGPVAYEVPLDYWWRGGQLRHGQVVVKRILLHRKRVSFPEIDDLRAPGMGEQEGHYQPVARGEVGRLSSRLGHRDLDSLSTWFGRHNRYSDWESYLRVNPLARDTVRDHRSRQGRVLEKLPLKPLVVFLYNYLAKGGWRDGLRGLEYATALAFYQFQISVKTRELKDVERA